MVRMLTEARGAGPCSAGRRSWPARAARYLRWLTLPLLCAPLCGCYLVQAAAGQWQLLRARTPLEQVIIDPRTPTPLRLSLERARAAREFASRELLLPDNGSYRSYADIGRQYVVWNVVATPEFSLQPRHWCFPVAGCVAYRGYFDEGRARRFAATLRAQGADVMVEGVPAYSTLGRFSDPVLSSMLPYGDDELAATLFHELAHQLLYVKDDSQFNEAFATAVEEEGLRRWLTREAATSRLEQWRAGQARAVAFLALFTHARVQLARLYSSGQSADAKRVGKDRVLAELAVALRQLEAREAVHVAVYDQWLRDGLNNAHLAALATYYDCVPGFERLLAANGDDLARFYAAARALARRPRAERHAQLCIASGE